MIQCPCCLQNVPEWMDGKVRVDLNTNTLLYRSQRLKLSGKQAELAYILAQSGHLLVSIPTLYAKLWGPDSPESINGLRIHISQLRKLLLKVGLTIQSVVGCGYRMMPL